MKLNINKPLVIFDLESTGLDLVNDRIIQISYIKVMPSGEEIRESFNVNPGKPIPELVTQLTGISDADVADAPCFKQLAATLAAKFKGCDFAGFNSNHFDVPMLAEEFLRAGIDFDFSNCRLIDAQTIFHKMNAAIWLLPTSFIVAERWRTTLKRTVPTKIPKQPIVC